MTFSRRDFLGAIGIAAAGSVPSLHGQPGAADLVLYNGKIVTVDDAFSVREAIAIKDGRIAAVGGNELRNRYPGVRAIDLRGRMIIPGFHDTHIHLGGALAPLYRPQRHHVACPVEATGFGEGEGSRTR